MALFEDLDKNKSKTELCIVYKKPDELNPYINNPRNNDEAVDMVIESINRFGFNVPITIDTEGTVVTGHTRLKAAKLLGMKSVPCIVLNDLTKDQIKAFRIADNRTSEIATWDMEALKIELEGIEMDMGAFTFELPDDIEPDAIEDNYIPVPPEEPNSKRGDIYRLGRHYLMCGDATNPEDVDALMGDNKADLLQTDPPYNVDYGSKAEAINKYGYHFQDRHIENDFMPSEQFISFLTDAFINAERVMRPGAAFYIWHASVPVFEFESALKEARLKSRQQLIWKKNSIVLGRQDYQWIHEPCLYGWKEGSAHYFIDDRTQPTVFEDEIPKFKQMKKNELIALLELIFEDKISTSVFYEDKPHRSDEHPTMKPIKLIGRQISNSTRKTENVLDLFGGSGSTLIACEQLNRTCYMMELLPNYVDVIIDRYEKFTGDTAELIRESE